MLYLVRTVLIVVCLVSSLQAQTVFNRVYAVGGNNLTELLVTDTGYISAAVDERGTKEVDFSIYDLMGNPLDTVSYQFDSIPRFPENCGKCLQSRHGKVYYAQYHSERLDSGYTVLFKLSSDLSIQKSVKYNYKDSLTTQLFAMEFDSDSTFIVTGLVFRKGPAPQGKYDLLVAKLDTAFNVIWEKRFEDGRAMQSLGYIGNDIIVDNYGSVIISGYGKFGPNVGLCVRLNPTDGSLVWLKEFPGSLSQGAMFTVDNGDGTYQFCQNEATALNTNGSVRYTKLRVGQIDTTGTIMWFKDLGPEEKFLIQYDLISTKDGNFYTAGFTYLNGNEVSYGLKFAPNGDSLWMRYYWHEDQRDLSHIEMFFETPDSGFIHAGYYADLFQSSGPGFFTWLLKTDQYGCDSIGCHTIGIPEVQEAGILEVFPNPSDGRFELQWMYSSSEYVDITLHDMTGRVIYRDEDAFLNSEPYTIDITDHSPGIYSLQLSVKGNPILTRKLVIR